jgi:hypothetical protein
MLEEETLMEFNVGTWTIRLVREQVRFTRVYVLTREKEGRSAPFTNAFFDPMQALDVLCSRLNDEEDPK